MVFDCRHGARLAPAWRGTGSHVKTIGIALAALALGIGVAACGNHNPEITITHQSGAPGGEATGTESQPASTTTAETTAAVTASPSQTTNLVQMTQATLSDMVDATRDLATNVSDTRGAVPGELQTLKSTLDGMATRAQQLPAGNPARTLLTEADQRLATTAGELETVATNGEGTALRAVADTLQKLSTDLGTITNLVTTQERDDITADLQTLGQELSHLRSASSSS